MTAAAPAANNLRGGLLLAAAGLCFTAEVVAVRWLDPGTPQSQIVLARALAQLGAVVLWAAWVRAPLLATARPGRHLARGLTSVVSWWLYYSSFARLDLATATVLTFSSALFVVVLAGPILGERVGARRWILTLVGFAGVVLAAQPDGLRIEPGVLFGLGAALAMASLIFQNRILSRTESTATIMFYIAVVAVLATVPVAVAGWRPLTAGDAALLAVAGSLGALGMLATIEAYRVGEVSALAPVPYLRLVFSIAAGLALFGEVPGVATLAGSALIVVAALGVDGRRR
ncbi:DMT family transporter [Rhodobacteraceae bacterium CCMM004]|nr:DMT family transporter [Rhodobacteraceae bacterium CCMM004]